jgi:hypothetical protein
VSVSLTCAIWFVCVDSGKCPNLVIGKCVLVVGKFWSLIRVRVTRPSVWCVASGSLRCDRLPH